MSVKAISLGALVGVMLSAIICVMISFGGSPLVGYLNHPLEPWPWLFRVSAIPSAVAMAAGANWLRRKRASRTALWVTGLFVSFFAVALAGTVGAIVDASLSWGLAAVNVEGYLTWGPIYSLGFLPLTWPSATIALGAIQRIARS